MATLRYRIRFTDEEELVFHWMCKRFRYNPNNVVLDCMRREVRAMVTDHGLDYDELSEMLQAGEPVTSQGHE